MIAVDTNILVYAHREDSPWHHSACDHLVRLGEDAKPWAIPWPCLHEFLAILTHPRIFKPPTPLQVACEQVDAWVESPRALLLSETTNYWQALRQTVIEGKIQSPLVHDARIASLCRHHGIQELWTADRDFSRFPHSFSSQPTALINWGLSDGRSSFENSWTVANTHPDSYPTAKVGLFTTPQKK